MSSDAIQIPRLSSSYQAATSFSPPGSGSFSARRSEPLYNAVRQPKVLHPVPQEELRLLLLENISQEAVRAFQKQGFQVDHFTKSLNEDELVAKIPQYHAIGIRSKTKITERVIKAATKVCILRISNAFSPTRSNSPIVARHRLLLYRNKPGRS